MDYNTAVEYTHSLLRFGSRPGLSRITALLEALSNPQKKLSAVHVAGTNGKGSVCVSLPYRSVPNKCAADGIAFALPKSCKYGS